MHYDSEVGISIFDMNMINKPYTSISLGGILSTTPLLSIYDMSVVASGRRHKEPEIRF